MTISVGGVELDASIIWQERHESAGVAQTVRRTLGGSPVIYTGQLVAGVPITLVATQNFGWLTKTQADAIISLAAVPGGVYELVFDDFAAEVVFRHDDSPAVELEPLLARQTHDADDHFTGAIKLLTV